MSPREARASKHRQLVVDAERHSDLAGYFGMVKRSICALGRRIPQNDVPDLILLAEVVDLAQRTMQTTVDQLRADGASWQQIGDALGVTKQAAEKRFG